MNNENKDHTHECKDCGWSGRDGQLLCAGKNKEKIPISQKTELYLCADCESVNVFKIGGEAVNEGVGVELKPCPFCAGGDRVKLEVKDERR